MINDPKQTTPEEILLIGNTYNIPIGKIEAVLQQDVKHQVAKAKKTVTKKLVKKSDLSPTHEEEIKFDDLEESYINASNKEEEKDVIRKFIQACLLPRQAKTLFQMCPDDSDLKDEIILHWVKITKNMSDLSEVKPLTKKGTPAGDLAYRKFVEFY